MNNHGSGKCGFAAACLALAMTAHCGSSGGGAIDAGTTDDGAVGPDATLVGLSIITEILPVAIVDVPYTAEVAASGGSGAGYAWVVTSGELPTGMSLTSGTPSATIAGTPTANGTYDFTLEVTDSESNSSSRALSIHVATGLFVDGDIGPSSCADYDPGSRSCGPGSRTAYDSLAGAAAVAGPGEAVLIRAGTYSGQLAPETSGAPGSPVTYTRYMDETVVLTGAASPAMILLDGVSHVTISGLTVANARWLEAVDANHNIIENCVFTDTPASGTTGNVRFISSDYNIIRNCEITGGNDNLLLIDSDRNLVEDNFIA